MYASHRRVALDANGHLQAGLPPAPCCPLGCVPIVVPGSGSIPGALQYCEHAVDDDGDRVRSATEISDVVARARVWMDTRIEAMDLIKALPDAIEVGDDLIGQVTKIMRKCQDFSVVPQFYVLKTYVAELLRSKAAVAVAAAAARGPVGGSTPPAGDLPADESAIAADESAIPAPAAPTLPAVPATTPAPEPAAEESSLFALNRGARPVPDADGASTAMDEVAVEPAGVDKSQYSADPSDFPKGRARKIVGKDVEIYWAQDDAWYSGVVLGLSKTKRPALKHCVVRYDDGIVSWEDARQDNVFFQVNSIL